MSNELQRGTTATNEVGQQLERTAETASTSLAMRERASVEARYQVAMHNPRNVDNFRSEILNICKYPAFAESAMYSKPVGGKAIIGLSIRFSDEAIKYYGNVHSSQSVVYEDDTLVRIEICLTDLQNNVSKSDCITVEKTIERRKIKQGQTPLSSRQNTYGDTVYILRATSDEMTTKVAANVAKIRRNLTLQILPQWVLSECQETIEKTRRDKTAENPDATKNRLIDAFASIGVKIPQLENILEHSVDALTPKELDDLRNIYESIKQGEAKISDYTKTKKKAKKSSVKEALDEDLSFEGIDFKEEK